MTENFYRTRKVNVDHSTFGGRIYEGDFDTYHSMSDIVSRIVSDQRFDEQCRKNTINRTLLKKGKIKSYGK